MFHGNKLSRWKFPPDCPGGTEPIGTFGVIEHDGGGGGEWVLCAGTGHRGEHTMMLHWD